MTDVRRVDRRPRGRRRRRGDGGDRAALWRLILDALAAGKDVVTANKALLAEHGPEVFAQARQVRPRGRLRGERRRRASRSSRRSGVALAANQVQSLAAIVNGTCNFILTLDDPRRPGLRRRRSAQAQELGYAEADPTLDVDGTDTAHKLAILAQLAFGANVHDGPDPPRGDRPAPAGRHQVRRPSSATRSSCWRWRSCRTRAWSCGSRRRWSSTGPRWPRSAARTTRSGSWATPSATRSSTAGGRG